MKCRFAPVSGQTIRDDVLRMGEELGLTRAPRVGVVKGLVEGRSLEAIEVTFRVPLPLKVIADIREEETIWLVMVPRDVCPWCYSARADFPKLPHVMREKGRPARICYTAAETNDWGIDKTLGDILIRLRQWLADAAAGKLVKEDEPYEPLWVSGCDGLVELNEKKAVEKTSGGKRKWETRATFSKVGGRRYFKVGGGGGGIDVEVLYQPEISDKPWDKAPSSVREVVELGAEIGWDLSPMLEAARRKSQLARFLVIFGVRRPKSIIGREGRDEWIGCLFTRNKMRKGELVGASKEERKLTIEPEKIWTVASFPVRSEFTRRLARRTSGWPEDLEERYVAVIGAGALGSCVVDNIVRGGLAKVTIIDNDTLAPHNLARHTLRRSELGLVKGNGIASYLNQLYEGNEVTAYASNALQMDKKLLEELNRCKFVVDLSTSRAVQMVLAESRYSGKLKVPIITGFMGAEGQAAFLLVDGTMPAINGNFLEAELISMHVGNSTVMKWLQSGKDLLETGGGCRLATSKIPWTLISGAGGWMSQNIAEFVQAQEHFKNFGLIGVSEMSKGELAWDARSSWFRIEKPTILDRVGWRICVSGRVELSMREKCAERNENESCGILMGTINRGQKIAFVTSIWDAPEDSSSKAGSCVRGRKGLYLRLVDNLRATGNQEIYLGEWHTHPRGATMMSARDLATSKKMAERLAEFGLPAILMISNENEIDAHVLEA